MLNKFVTKIICNKLKLITKIIELALPTTWTDKDTQFLPDIADLSLSLVFR